MSAGTSRVLTINSGSSSVRYALFEPAEPRPRRVAEGTMERVGASDEAAAVRELIGRLGAEDTIIAAIGHRIVHGGPRYDRPERVTPELLAELRRIVPFAPNHLPRAIALIEAFAQHYPDRPQIVCFDTAFHHDLPVVARMLPIPRRYASQGVRRYGFHGLSYTYLLEELRRVVGPEVANGRVIFAHLGNGASMAAVKNGKCVDTSMGFTPIGGLVMSTRTGDLDPGVLAYLAREEKLSPDALQELAARQSGLLGISETSADMRDLIAAGAKDPRAAEAVDVFCYQARKFIGAYAAALGGLDALVFAGGIGEHAREVRAQICEGLDFLGIQIDAPRNNANAPVISPDDTPVQVRIIPTDEEVVIAKAIYAALSL
jgi:acetate kinase